MRKQEFLNRLRARIYVLPTREREERLNFYSEMIDDKMEEGLSEQEAVASVGSIEEIAAQLLEEAPLSNREKRNAGRQGNFERGKNVLLIVGSPVWVPLAIAAAAIVFSLFAVLWAGILSIWAAFAAVTAVAPAAVIIGAIDAIMTSVPTGLVLIGGGVFCAGLAIFLFFGCLAATKGLWILMKRSVLGIVGFFRKGGDV